MQDPTIHGKFNVQPDAPILPHAIMPMAAPSAKEVIQAQIDSLEREQILPRATREGLLLTMETFGAMQGVTPDVIYANNIAYHKMKDFDNMIANLRSQL